MEIGADPARRIRFTVTGTVTGTSTVTFTATVTATITAAVAVTGPGVRGIDPSFCHGNAP
jgi:hypothetical protein